MSRLNPKHQSLFQLAVMFVAATAGTFATTIDFENQCPSGQQSSGPCSSLFSNAGNAETLIIPTSIGNVIVEGGALFDGIANLPADESALYGTAGNAAGIGVSTGSGFTNPLTLTFPVALTSFSVDVLNGNTTSVEYQVADNAGNSSEATLAPNFSGGLQDIEFSATGTVVTISAVNGQSTANGMTWDFLIDNISFTGQSTVSSATPEPASALLIGIGLMALGLARYPGKNSEEIRVRGFLDSLWELSRSWCGDRIAKHLAMDAMNSRGDEFAHNDSGSRAPA